MLDCVMMKMIRITGISLVSIITVLFLIQSIYSVGFKRYCSPHYLGKRIYFSTHHDLATQWEFDILGVVNRTMEDLLVNHPEITRAAFESAGNMHNPRVKAFGSIFKHTISNMLCHSVKFKE